MKGWQRGLVGFGATALVTAVLFPVFVPARPYHHVRPCLTRLKMSATGLLIYQSDFDRAACPGGTGGSMRSIHS